MARANLGDLLGKVEDSPQFASTKPQQEYVPRVQTPGLPSVPASANPALPESRPTKPKAAPVEPALPAYLRFVRKETRLREDQQNELTLAARRLNRAKAAGTPRITDNTLIRIAVDLLLSRLDRASGDDESMLLESLNR